MIVIICDGSSRGNPGPASVGVIIWNRLGKNSNRIVRPTCTIYHSIGNRTNMEAEWEALIASVKWVQEHNKPCDDVYIYNDSLVTVKQVNRVWAVKHAELIPLSEKFFMYMAEPELKNCVVTWIPRQLAYLADKEAQKGDAV